MVFVIEVIDLMNDDVMIVHFLDLNEHDREKILHEFVFHKVFYLNKNKENDRIEWKKMFLFIVDHLTRHLNLSQHQQHLDDLQIR